MSLSRALTIQGYFKKVDIKFSNAHYRSACVLDRVC